MPRSITHSPPHTSTSVSLFLTKIHSFSYSRSLHFFSLLDYTVMFCSWSSSPFILSSCVLFLFLSELLLICLHCFSNINPKDFFGVSFLQLLVCFNIILMFYKLPFLSLSFLSTSMTAKWSILSFHNVQQDQDIAISLIKSFSQTA